MLKQKGRIRNVAVRPKNPKLTKKSPERMLLENLTAVRQKLIAISESGNDFPDVSHSYEFALADAIAITK